ncbi:hypothetical protein Moror_17848 [Moniliophthora roreri MCA 2997]|uniref:Uncharacterized protein n=1 Tax=Moniliophthora roreri (strain MCA 2997) TaxID=1381753 RepID=V2XDM1_MONRO|nr:hypothetical protein Moror_17848 [Moniliophthora roreri MCA 2997]
MFSGYLPHLLYSIAITSLSLHLVYQKRFFSEQRHQIDARISVLESIADELRSEKSLSPEELQRLTRLARPTEEIKFNEKFSWKEVILGRIGRRPSEGNERS